jgi:uncharacterized protein YybS (DUF2232 family)
VAEFCTCGAKLVDDALFCHKCGKPQREIVAAEPEPEPEPPPLPAAVATAAVPLTPEISFHNRIAVRVALLCAAVASLLISVPMPVFVAAFWVLLCLTVSGFLAVYLYHRRTGTFLTVRSGARMGWLTGVFCYAIALVLFALTAAVVSRQGGLAEVYRKQMQSQSGANIEEALKILESPGGVTMVVIFTLVVCFVFFTGLPTIGGALGAKVLEKE